MKHVSGISANRVLDAPETRASRMDVPRGISRVSQGNRLKERHGPGRGRGEGKGSNLAADARAVPPLRSIRVHLRHPRLKPLSLNHGSLLP